MPKKKKGWQLATWVLIHHNIWTHTHNEALMCALQKQTMLYLLQTNANYLLSFLIIGGAQSDDDEDAHDDDDSSGYDSSGDSDPEKHPKENNEDEEGEDEEDNEWCKWGLNICGA